MACGEHHCTKCDWVDFSNDAITVCPICAAHVVTFFDEPDEDFIETLEEENDYG